MMMYGAATWDFMWIHYDADYTWAKGFSQTFVEGQMLRAFLAQLVVWIGQVIRLLSEGDEVLPIY